MKKNKLIYFLAAIGACTLLALSVFLFPLIIAATPENRELETLELDDPYPVEELGLLEEHELEKVYLDDNEPSTGSGEQESITQHDPDPVEVIDINAITKEIAIGIAERLFSKEPTDTYPVEHSYVGPTGESRNASWILLGARYIPATDNMAAPVWQVFIHEKTWGITHFRIPDDRTPESYLAELENERATQLHGCCTSYSIYKRETGTTILKSESSYETITMLELDAFTGEVLGSGWFVFCEHNSHYNLFVNAAAPDWELITDYMEYSVLLPEFDGSQYHRFDLPPIPEP